MHFFECSETFCYTLSEALAAGIPVLAYEIGAVGERIKENNIGKIVKLSEKPKNIISEIRKCKTDNKWLEIRSNVKKFTDKGVRKMCKEYASIYENLFGREVR